VGGVLPVVATGLLQHEAKLSVVNFSVKKVTGYAPAIANKEELLLVFGVRSFLARPVWSSDDSGADKHKMQRFLQAGVPAVGSIYAPIMYAPQPVLAFKVRGWGCRA
jgi:pre-rRNA-processing protein TSR1